MAPPGFHVIVVRAWRGAGGLRIRLIADGADRAAGVDGVPGRQWVVGSIAEARDVLGSLLAELLAAPAQPEAPDRPLPPSTPD
jgi:hypothetical protein